MAAQATPCGVPASYAMRRIADRGTPIGLVVEVANEIGFDAAADDRAERVASLARMYRAAPRREDLMASARRIGRAGDADVIATFALSIGADPAVVEAVRDAAEGAEEEQRQVNTERERDRLAQAVEERMRATAEGSQS